MKKKDLKPNHLQPAHLIRPEGSKWFRGRGVIDVRKVVQGFSPQDVRSHEEEADPSLPPPNGSSGGIQESITEPLTLFDPPRDRGHSCPPGCG